MGFGDKSLPDIVECRQIVLSFKCTYKINDFSSERDYMTNEYLSPEQRNAFRSGK